MKRLKFMLAAATAIGLTTASQATLEYNGSTNFEDGMPSSSYWSFAGAEGDNESELVSLSSDIVATSFPRVWASSSHTNYYKVSTGTEPVLFRPDTSDVSIPEDGLYVDTLVQFTVTPAGEQVTAGSGDKLLIYLKEMTNGVGTVTGTNLVAVAGYYGYENDALAFDPDHEYVLQTSTPVQPGQWYRLTVKALGNVIASEFAEQLTHAAFSIYLDGADTPLQANVAPIDIENETLMAFFSEGALTDIGDRKLVFSRKANDLTISGVGFAGEGAVDDIAFTTADPFATAYDFTLTLGEGISGVSFTINGTEQPQLSSYTVYAGDVIEVGQVAYADGYMGPYTPRAENLSGDGPYTVGAADCSLTLSAFLAPTVATVSGVTSTFANGVYTFTAPQGCVIGSLLVDGELVSDAAGKPSYDWTAVAGASVVVSAKKALSAPAHAWYEAPAAVVLAENLPGQTGNIVSAFHGQGQDEYLGLTYSTNPLQFDLFEVDGTAALVTNRSVAVGDTGAGFRGVAISKTLGIAMTLAYATDKKMLAYPLVGGAATEVVKPSTYSFDAGAFSPDGAYFFSNALNGESANTYYVKWSVSVANGIVTLTKVGSIAASGRGRSLAYGRINGRDVVFALVDTGKIDVIDMTGDTPSNWTSATLLSGLPAHSYGTLCVSGVNVVDSEYNPVKPLLTVATSTNNGATKIDVLNVYELTVPSSGAVTASLVKSFDEDALTAAGFGDISDANRYGNTVYVTDDNKTIYFARPDNKLYAAQYPAPLAGWAALLGAAVDGAYEIDDLAELKAFQTNVGTLATAGETFKLTADIALDTAWPGIGIQNGKDIYTTAEYDAGAFRGTFDGQNHTISGFQMAGGGLDYCGFFNSTYGATIQNLKIQYAGALFAADTTASTAESGATFVGVAKNSTLDNLTTLAGTVSCSKGFGGIVGFLTSGTTVQNCTNNVNMTSLANNKCGGIAMITQGGSAVTISNCQNNGTQTTGSSNSEYGAIVGYVGLNTTIADCETSVGRFLKHQSGTVTLQGVNKGDATVLAYHGASTPGLNFATVNGNVATFVADNALALNGSYKVMASGATATFAFAEAGTIAFDAALATPTYAITAAEGLTLTDATVGTVTTYTAAGSAPSGEEVAPGGQSLTTYATQAEAEAALTGVTIKASDAVAAALGDTSAYIANFERKVVAVDGGYKVEVALTAAAEAALQAQADADAAAVIADLSSATVTLATTPGFYYSFEYGTALEGMAEVGTRTLATGSTLTLTRPTTAGATAGFYKVLINIMAE